MHVITVTNITYQSPCDAPTELTFGFDEPVDVEYLQCELKSHIEEETQQLVDTFEYTISEQSE